MTKDKRADIRIPLLSEKVQIRGNAYIRQLEVADVSAGGLFIKVTDVKDFLRPQDPVIVNFAMPGDLGGLELMGEVRRIHWAINKKKNITNMGMAIMLWDIPDGRRKIWDAFRIYLRNKQIITVSKRIIEEFFGAPKT